MQVFLFTTPFCIRRYHFTTFVQVDDGCRVALRCIAMVVKKEVRNPEPGVMQRNTSEPELVARWFPHRSAQHANTSSRGEMFLEVQQTNT